MDAYEIYNIIPKDGAVKGIHGVILGRKCWISDVRIGHRGCLWWMWMIQTSGRIESGYRKFFVW